MASDELRLVVGVAENYGPWSTAPTAAAIGSLSRISRPLSGRADRFNSGFFRKQKRNWHPSRLRHRKRWFKNGGL